MSVNTRARKFEHLLGGDLDQRLFAMRELALLSREVADLLLEAERQLTWASREMEAAARLAAPAKSARVSTKPTLPCIDPIPTADLLGCLGITRGVFEKMRRAARFPKAVRISGNRIGFRRAEILQWLEERGDL
jgi:predicted DNA-binding transcriptional regulator AlpA